jgi:ergothioneine biosynthesis protein EgtB
MLNTTLAVEFEKAISYTDRMFSAVKKDAWLAQPIPLRNPVIFYFGHLPAFAWNQVFRNVLKLQSFNSEFDRLFERGIDPPDDSILQSVSEQITDCHEGAWPTLHSLGAYKGRIETELFALLWNLDVGSEKYKGVRQALFMTLEHYWMHIETFHYMLHQLPASQKTPITCLFEPSFASPDERFEIVNIPAGTATLGAARGSTEFAWCNEYEAWTLFVDEFGIDKFNVTNAQFREFVEAGGYKEPSLWSETGWQWVIQNGREHPPFWRKDSGANSWLLQGLFELHSLPEYWPVYVTHAEAEAYCRWRGTALPTEAQYHRAAFSTACGAERQYPWGDYPEDGITANIGLKCLSPTAVGSAPHTKSFWGVHDLVGNGWEWTRTTFAPFPGFKPLATYPGYSADFFDGRHYVLKGASPFTAERLVRRSFRNWFQAHYPYLYATFRTVVPATK